MPINYTLGYYRQEYVIVTISGRNLWAAPSVQTNERKKLYQPSAQLSNTKAPNKFAQTTETQVPCQAFQRLRSLFQNAWRAWSGRKLPWKLFSRWYWSPKHPLCHRQTTRTTKFTYIPPYRQTHTHTQHRRNNLHSPTFLLRNRSREINRLKRHPLLRITFL